MKGAITDEFRMVARDFAGFSLAPLTGNRLVPVGLCDKGYAVRNDDQQVQDFAADLGSGFSGDIHLDRFTRILYSTDASIYQIEPLAVLLPRGHDDVAAAVSLAARYGLPLLPRGGGTGLAGQTVASAVVIDFSKYMNRILEVNFEDRCARVEPGVILDQLNAQVGKSGWRFPPDVATSNRATLGGMIGNNSSGSHSILYGVTLDHVRRMRMILATGEEADFAELTAEEWAGKAAREDPEGRMYRTVNRLVTENREEINARYPKIMRRVGGYNLDGVIREGGGNLCRLIVGSEGTLATCTETVLNLAREPRAKGLDLVHFSDLVAALEALQEILPLQPAAVELVDKMLLDLTRLQPGYARKMGAITGDPAAILIVEFFGETEAEVRSKCAQLDRHLQARNMGTTYIHVQQPADQAAVWAIRKAGVGLLSSIPGDYKPVAFVEDTAVAAERLSEYVRRFRQILARHNVRAGYYGHASVGCLHIRPLLNLKEASGVQKMADISAAVKELVVEFKGSMSGEHGDGLVRSHWNRQLFGEQRTFRRWLRDHPPRTLPQGAPKVVLFNDTFTNYNEPWIGIAALRILEDSGAQVLVPEVACCGRPMISKGLLDKAKGNARANVAVLAPLVEAGAFVVGCEPSCILTLRDDYPDLLGTKAAQKLAEKVLSLEEYLCRRLDTGSWQPRFVSKPGTVLLHGHCHQKSLVGSEPSMRLLRMPPGFTAEEVDSGCCGMAGAFGYEKEHYEISLQVGERRLFPAIRNSPADALIVASGTSCRQQILHATGRKALHMAEVLAGLLVAGGCES